MQKLRRYSLHPPLLISVAWRMGFQTV